MKHSRIVSAGLSAHLQFVYFLILISSASFYSKFAVWLAAGGVCVMCRFSHFKIELNYSWITFNNSNDGTTFFPGSDSGSGCVCAFTIILNFTKRNLNRLTVLIKFVVWTFWLVDVCVCAINFPCIFANVASKLMSCSVYYCFFFLTFFFLSFWPRIKWQ